jgi:hypothetical protein
VAEGPAQRSVDQRRRENICKPRRENFDVRQQRVHSCLDATWLNQLTYSTIASSLRPTGRPASFASGSWLFV